MWKNRGLIFDLESNELKGLGLSYAQSPQAIQLGDKIRVYFSTRSIDTNGKQISSVRYVEFAPDFSEILTVSSFSSVSPSGLGTFDEHGIFPLNVLQVDGEFRAYSSGWSRRISVDITMAIGLLTSSDHGETFQRVGAGPCLGANLSEPFLVGDPYVYLDGETFHMWYIYGTQWVRDQSGRPERNYRIGHRTSTDGVSWEQYPPEHDVITPITDSEAQALPSVITIGKSSFMCFCFRDTFNFREGGTSAYHLGLARSQDFREWTRISDFGDWRSSTWDSEMMCYPNFFKSGETINLLYNGNKFGKRGFGLAQISSVDFQSLYKMG